MSKEIINRINIYPWRLFAPNIEDPNRRIGLTQKDISDRKYLASFIGAHMSHYINDDRTILSGINSKNSYIQVYDKWHYDDEVYKQQIQNEKAKKSQVEEQNKKTSNYNKVLSDSKFSLCPLGAGPNTLRFWESIAIGSIPVFFNEKFIPPFLQEYNMTMGVNLDPDDIFAYVDLKRENPSAALESLSKYTDDELKRRSKLCKEYYSFANKQLCFGNKVQALKANGQSFKVDFYTWPNSSFPFRLYFYHPKLRIFII